MDASNLLKPALARGKLRCIGATTINEYRKYIEKDKALERRFQQVMIEQPTPEDTVSILRGLKSRYEGHHGVRIRDEALLAAAKLSHRYIPDRFLPDKAIDLMDEACAKLKNELTSKPTIIDEIDRRIIQLEMERLSLNSDYEGSEDTTRGRTEGVRLTGIDAELENLQRQQQELNMRWLAEKGGVDRLKSVKTDIEKVNLEIEKCEREFDLNRAAELKYSTLPQLLKELERLEVISDEGTDLGGERMLKDEVTADDIANVVAVWTGIPPNKLLESEKDRILNMADNLNQRVIGQHNAVEVVTEAIQRSRAGLNDPTKPIASLIFLGPTGVGKTELCKALSEFMFDSEEALIRIDMSEYMEKHTVSRLLGAPPGYVGYDEGGQLTDAVRRKPYAVLLFDEIEKAHPDVFNVMLQLLDDGRLTDSKGTSVNFRNTICIFTSNIGSKDILDLTGEEGQQAIMRQRVLDAMKDHFRPEFLNRIDEQVIFNSLTRADLREIVKLEIKRLEKRLAEKEIILDIKEAALDYLADVGFDPIYGARPLKRTIQRSLETVVARGILSGTYGEGDTIVCDVLNERLHMSRLAGVEAPSEPDSEGEEEKSLDSSPPLDDSVSWLMSD
jgi:ATP-dependent Clp protease ATP-binding subunit ClpB